MTGLTRLIVLGLVLTAFAPSADAMTWPRAVALAHAFIYQHNTNAFRQLQDASRQGDSAAQTALGAMYVTGQGVTPNLPRAVHWFQLAARQGDARAQNNLGSMYATGKGVTPNLPRAFHWYQLAARQGFARAQYTLGYMYATGKGVTPNLPRAVRWYQLAARQGYKPAIKRLRALQQQLQRTAHARPLPAPAAAPAPAGAQRASTASPVHDQQQSVRNLQRFWTLYFQAAHARLVDFGAPALVQPVSFAAAHP